VDADLTTGPDVSPAPDGSAAGGPAAGDPGPAGAAHPEPPAPEAPKPAPSGRNLPVAAGIGVLLGGLVVATLFTVKATFLIFMAVAIGIGLWEMARAFRANGINVPLVPIVAAGAAMWLCEYWWTNRAVLASLVLGVVAILAWRLTRGPDGYLRDVSAGVFLLAYLPFPALFVVAMLAAPDGARRVLIFVILVVCVDVGGYFAGSTLGRHPMAQAISPSKTWEGLAGSVLLCLIAGAVTVPLLLHGHVWQGLLTGAAAGVAAVVGDLAESAIKRDLKVKDLGSLLPGHGGVMDRLDSLLVAAPVAWLLLAVFVK
jgi:phosphatidate cytidylyltransferase